jgi:hypothetical protein
MKPAQQRLMAPNALSACPLNKFVLDTLAELLQEEGAQEFDDEFFEYVYQHGTR